ncbi:ribonucleases P/MRP protein subunit POP1-like isoform X1 [Zingiber officinale]|uniref:ribonucleases P/MRP protein subunit POP1-like isoform X1 n=1 Tax=Zingiber officinale TaxID=94328 RepID=UPI001C4B486E|nr:ribonucleases P/MRP protein subunit POP1-like isoform X1 [Zingiber officinale]
MTMDSKNANSVSISSAPPLPRTLNVHSFTESRAAELVSLHNIISTRLNGDFRIRRDKRRRTTGHRTTNNHHRHSKRRKVQGDNVFHGEDGENDKKIKKVSRKTRRRMEFQDNPISGFGTSGDGTKRLRTHLWHAKRFTMIKRWGFHLPQGLHGRGRGSRAVLRWCKNGALVHDSSYNIPIQLEGAEGSILAILRMVLFPSPALPANAPEMQSRWVAQGDCCGNAMLYHFGAPISKQIAPVIYMWSPLPTGNNNNSMGQHGNSNISGSSHKGECISSNRKLWIWIHAAAIDEGFDVLNNACQKQMHEFGSDVRCFKIEGQVARLDVMGSKATQMLEKILHPVSLSGATEANSMLNQSSNTACINSNDQKLVLLDHMENLPSHAILSLTTHDPRDLPSSGNEIQVNEHIPSLDNDFVQKDYPNINEKFHSGSKSLWDFADNLFPPIPESILCKERHDKRLYNFYLEPSGSGEATEAKDDPRRYCPLLLLKHSKHGSLHMGWSIILPLCWVKVFWVPLVSHGFHAIGLRERRWIACNSGLPSFPFDFPDCQAYSSFMVDEAAAINKASERRPPAVRAMKVPIPPPWNCIATAFDRASELLPALRPLKGLIPRPCKFLSSTFVEGPDILRACQEQQCQTSSRVVSEEPIVGLDSEDRASSSMCQVAGSFSYVVPRTSEVLNWYFENIHSGDLHLLPKIHTGKNCTIDWAKSSTNSRDIDKKLCFVQVLLHAYKEGVFEEGAMVCAPLSRDLSRWTSRSEEMDDQELKVPQSFVQSCFIEQGSGKWEMLDPEECSTVPTFRWPIGFVTTGFVHGSSNPVAVAYCEARLLAALREQQSSVAQITDSKILIFVRNMRSTAYRRAHAIIAIEDHNDDLEFL